MPPRDANPTPSFGGFGLKERIEKNELGMKTGTGFYQWTPGSAEALRQKISEALVKIELWEHLP